MFNFSAYFFPRPAGALTDAFAKAACAFAEFFSGLHGLAARHVLAKALASASHTLTAFFVGMTDSAVPAALNTPATPAIGHTQTTFLILVLILILSARIDSKNRTG
jgi:hypothetical protein